MQDTMRKRKGLNHFKMTAWSSGVLLKNPVLAVLCLLPVLRVQSTEYNCVDSVVSPEEQPVRKTRVVRQTGNVFMVFKSVNRQTPTHFLWLSVRVMPCEDTLKCTTVEEGAGSELSRSVVAFCTAW